MSAITSEIVEEFKLRMHLDDDEDGNLQGILERSVAALKRACGDYDLSDPVFKELVFERARYAYNDALEYFYTNFITQINNLMLAKAMEESDPDGVQPE